MDTQEFLGFAEKYKNWGRWGKDDEIGTLNFVSPQAIVDACHLVRKGAVFSLAIPFDSNGPQRPGIGRRFNPIHSMLRTGMDHPGMLSGDPPIVFFADDMVTMPLQSATQWDSLAHAFFKGKMYNDRPASLVDGQGARKNSIDKVKKRMVGRGVLVDIPRHRGVPWLDLGQSVPPDELDACLRRQKVEVKEGDFLLVRTGVMAHSRSQKDWRIYNEKGYPGLNVSCAPWLYEKRVAAVCSDCSGVEEVKGAVGLPQRAAPADGSKGPHPEPEAELRYPLHCVCLVNMGMMFGEIFDLDELAEDCAQDGVYEFLFVAAPLPFTKAVGSPVNPYAIK